MSEPIQGEELQDLRRRCGDEKSFDQIAAAMADAEINHEFHEKAVRLVEQSLDAERGFALWSWFGMVDDGIVNDAHQESLGDQFILIKIPKRKALEEAA